MKNIQESNWCGGKLPRYRLGILGDLSEKEKHALYPPFGVEERKFKNGEFERSRRRELRPSDSEIMAVLDGDGARFSEHELRAVVEVNGGGPLHHI